MDRMSTAAGYNNAVVGKVLYGKKNVRVKKGRGDYGMAGKLGLSLFFK